MANRPSQTVIVRPPAPFDDDDDSNGDYHDYISLFDLKEGEGSTTNNKNCYARMERKVSNSSSAMGGENERKGQHRTFAILVAVILSVLFLISVLLPSSSYQTSTVPEEIEALTKRRKQQKYFNSFIDSTSAEEEDDDNDVLSAVSSLTAHETSIIEISNKEDEEEDEHTTPTLLSVVHPRTGRYVDALDNPLYEQLKMSTFSVDISQKHNGGIMMTRGLLRGGDTDILPMIDSSKDSNLNVNHPPTKLHLDKNVVSLHESLTLSWSYPITNNDQENHVIALYCPADNVSYPKQFRDAATIAQAKATSRKHRIDLGLSLDREENEHDEEYHGSWYIPSFPIIREDTCQFRLWKRQQRDHEDDVTRSIDNNNNNNNNNEISQEVTPSTIKHNSFVLAATSDIIHLSDMKRTPTAIHLALTNNPSEMLVQFTTGEVGTPVVQYGKSTDKTLSNKAEGTSTTYTAQDMCQEPATSTEPGKFIPPGMLHFVKLTNLQCDTDYSYKVGLASGQGIVWSDKYTFQSSPGIGPSSTAQPISYIVYGDQGCPVDGWAMGGQRTASLVQRELDDGNDSSSPIRMVHHFGDLSYARGAAHLWDDWFDMIQVFTTRVPLMIGIGNHEYDHADGGDNGKDPSGVPTPNGFMPLWGNFGTDSGGECGVPTSKRFVMPTSNNDNDGNGVFWYSYDYALVHTVVISSEHNLTKGSRQHEWLEVDLASVDRNVTPWVIVESHRPMYNSEAFWDQNRVGVAMRYAFEDLLHEHDVDLVLAGHYHSYLRTCDGLYRSKCNNGGPTHITVGSAGARVYEGTLYEQHWTEHFRQEWGYGRITIANATALHFEFVAAGLNDTGMVKDDVWIWRER